MSSKALVVALMMALAGSGIALSIQLRNANDKIEQLNHIIHSQHGSIAKSDENNKRLIQQVEKTLYLAQRWKEKCDG